MGIMDEERRTVNLARPIDAAHRRVFFINARLPHDRTGNEIHTVMEAGPVVHQRRDEGRAWIAAYET